MKHLPPVIRVVGDSGSGKTTLIERLLPRLAARGLKVGVVKHAHHGLTLDQRGKDSWRIWRAGAPAVVVAAPDDVLVRQRREWSRVSEVLELLPRDVDCILLEGFTRVGAVLDVAVLADIAASTPPAAAEAAIIEALDGDG